MKKKILESSVLFVSIVKWLFLASCIGIIVGISTTVFLKVLSFGISAAARYPNNYFVLPVALFFSALIVKIFAPGAEGHGTEKIIEAVHRHAGKMNLAVVPVKLVATIITIALGGSAGKEGHVGLDGVSMSYGDQVIPTQSCRIQHDEGINLGYVIISQKINRNINISRSWTNYCIPAASPITI